jgi:hypothetical protein
MRDAVVDCLQSPKYFALVYPQILTGTLQSFPLVRECRHAASVKAVQDCTVLEKYVHFFLCTST